MTAIRRSWPIVCRRRERGCQPYSRSRRGTKWANDGTENLHGEDGKFRRWTLMLLCFLLSGQEIPTLGFPDRRAQIQ